jgi:hypothetical protein
MPFFCLDAFALMPSRLPSKSEKAIGIQSGPKIGNTGLTLSTARSAMF